MKKFAEFFAGVGLVNSALSLSGWECVWANDICPDKQAIYIDNFGNDHFHLGDVWQYATESHRIPDDCFLYTASFPCTDMSLAGERKGLAGAESGTLNAVLRVIEEKKKQGSNPAMVMLENVQGFLTSHKGADVAYTVEAFNSLGYIVDLIELDASHFTPQSRPRVFLFAVNEEIAPAVMEVKEGQKLLDSWWSIFESNPALRTKKVRDLVKKYQDLKWGAFKLPLPQPRTTSLSDIVEKELHKKQDAWWSDERKDHLYSQMSNLHKSVLEKMIAGKSITYGTVYRRTRNGVSCAELRADGVAGCLRTPRGGSSKQILVSAGNGKWSVRLLTPREYARLQGVADSFKLPKNANKGYFAMGDAVCVPAVSFLTKHILDKVYKSTRSN